MVALVGKYFPFGQERPSATTNNKEKFATYYRDSETGLDYAQNRYHQPGHARFLTPDPFGGSARAANPGSWNRYAYSGGDPVNNNDPNGLDVVDNVDGQMFCLNQQLYAETGNVEDCWAGVGVDDTGGQRFRHRHGWLVSRRGLAERLHDLLNRV